MSYSRYMDRSLDEMAADMSYPSDTHHQPDAQELDHTHDTGSAYEPSSGLSRDAYRDRADTHYLPFAGSNESGGLDKGSEDCVLFASNLNYRSDWQQLKDYMKTVGRVERCDIFMDSGGRSKGTGRCVFADAESAETALRTLNETVFDGRRLKLRKSVSSEDTKRRVKPPRDASATVFIHNLDHTVTWQKLKDIFKVVGRVANVEIVEGHKGSAVVQFVNPDDAIKSIALYHGQMLMDRPMKLRMDSNAPYQPDPLKLKLSALQSSSGHDSLFSRRKSPSPDRYSRDRDYGYSSTRYADDRTSDSRYSRVDLIKRELADTVYLRDLTLSRDLDRDDIYYSRARESERRRSRSLDRRYRRSRSRSRGRRRSLSRGRSRERENSDVLSVFVTNLSYGTTWQTLKDNFRKAGDVRRADIKTNRDGKPQGNAVVHFESHRGASHAIELFDRTILDGRRISVRFDRLAHQ